MNDLKHSPITADTVSWNQQTSPDGDMPFLSPADATWWSSAPVTTFSQSNLVSDAQTGHLNAQVQDPNLINPWGVAYSPTGFFWVNNNHTGTATIYDVNPMTNATTAEGLVVTIAPPAGQTFTASPTGIVFNSDPNGFMLNGKPATFIMDTEDGTISAWNGGMTTTLEVDNSTNAAEGDGSLPPQDQTEGVGAVYKGLAIGTTRNGTTQLYAANFRHGTVDVFNTQFQQVASLTDGSIQAGYAPFNVQVLGNHLFVTFAKQDPFKHDDKAGAGHGFVDEFSLSGSLIARVASKGPLNSPWGLAIAPRDFGTYAGDLLVGNFGDGTISAFDLHNNDQFVGKLTGADGKPITIGDLWSLTPGNGGSAGSKGQIYFTAGVHAESQGIFGSIARIPGTNEFMMT
ncbi:MAG TPA: TIGR03118 family protein [Acidisphaera sp.]|nr:TIGR03118 family protein [Acidisphaera sp.]